MGWDIERFPQPNKELICCICTGILEDPVEIKCRHVYCRECLDTWVKTRPVCPTCRAPVVRAFDIRPVVPMLKNIISRQIIFCENRENGCEESLALDSLRSHLKKCLYGKVECINAGCTVLTIRRDAESHSTSCSKRLVSCLRGCGLIMTKEDSDCHNCINALRTYFNAKTAEHKEHIRKLEEKVELLASTVYSNFQAEGRAMVNRDCSSITADSDSSTELEFHSGGNISDDFFPGEPPSMQEISSQEAGSRSNDLLNSVTTTLQFTEAVPRITYRPANVERSHQSRRRQRRFQSQPHGHLPANRHSAIDILDGHLTRF